MFARRAMFHMVAELMDAGRIDEDTALHLEAGLRTYDRQMVLEEPVSRPTQLHPIANLTFGADRMAWVEGVSEALTHTDWSPSEGTTVLAEKTHLRTQGNWETPTEDRYSLIRSAGYDPLETVSDPDAIFETTVKALISEYPQTAVDSESSNLVVRNSNYGYDSPGADWLAFSAEMALRLGWSFSADGMFRWVDSQGRTMVESIWWTDGVLSSLQLRGEEVGVGEGWFVLASQSAVEAIRGGVGPLHRKSIVTRRIRKDGEEIDRSANCQHPV